MHRLARLPQEERTDALVAAAREKSFLICAQTHVGQ